mmetsp:Transcript_7729/g.12973  ORF Transcript_7729/g.12973 Transcript_7729/m.12973 type:complete len:223 (+) Transcript_7729:347-1015(+)
MPLGYLLEIVWGHLKHLDDPVKEVRVLPQARSSLHVHRDPLVLLPDLLDNSRRGLGLGCKGRVTLEVELGDVDVARLHVVLLLILGGGFVGSRVGVLGVLDLKDLELLLSTAVVMLAGGPVVVELSPDLAVFLLLFSLDHEGVLEKLGPAQSLVGGLVQQTLEEGLELGGHVLGELDGVLDDEVDERVDAVGVEGRRALEQLVDDDAEGPEVDGVVVGQFLH